MTQRLESRAANPGNPAANNGNNNNKKKQQYKYNAYECPFNCALCNFFGKELLDLLQFDNLKQEKEKKKELETNINNGWSLSETYEPFKFIFEKHERIYNLLDQKYNDDGKHRVKNSKKSKSTKKVVVDGKKQLVDNNVSKVPANNADYNYGFFKLLDVGPITAEVREIL